MIDNKERIEKLESNRYRQLFGVTKETFVKMLTILEDAYDKLHLQGGKPPKLSVLDKLIITLCYWREYRTYRHIAFDYGVGKSAIGDSVKWVENTLMADGTFSLPSKRTFEQYNNEIDAIVVDVTEQEIERPKRGRHDGTLARRDVTR